jgi:hypothetical protein
VMPPVGARVGSPVLIIPGEVDGEALRGGFA